MALDVAMGGSTNTVLHLLAAAQEAELEFTMQDIDEISRRVPCLSKLAPNGTYLMEDVPPRGRHPRDPRRAAPRRAAQRATSTPSTPTRSSEWLADWDIRSGAATDEAIELFHAAPGCVRSADRVLAVRALGDAGHRRGRAAASATSSTRTPRTAGSRSCTATSPCDGCVVKTAGVDESILTFSGPARGRRVPGRGGRADPQRRRARRRRDRHPLRGTEGRAGHAGDALPDVLPQGPRARQGVRADHRRALLAAARRASRSATSRRRRRRVARSRSSRRATRSTSTSRTARSSWRSRTRSCRSAAEAITDYVPAGRDRVVSPALRAYAAMATSADRGAVRDVSLIEERVRATT